MTIRFAHYKNEEKIIKIAAKDIGSIEEYQSKYKNHLHCSEAGCEAKIELAHRRSSPYFRTWQNSKHAPDCYYGFESSPDRNPARRGEELLIAISAKHKKAALQYSDRKRKEDEGQAAKRGATSRTINRERQVNVSQRLVATVNPEAKAIGEGMREAPIPTRTCNDITAKDVNHTINIRGYVYEAVIDENSVSFLFDTKSETPVQVLFYSRFRDNSRQAYNWVQQIGEALNEGERYSVSCIGICERKRDGFSIQIFDIDAIHLNEKSLPAFMHNFKIT